MEPMGSSSLRVYGGVAGNDRKAERRAQLIEAGLELLGTGDGEQGVTVRGVCKRSGLTARYFYENFAGRDELAVAVFDHVVSGIATATLQAVEAAPAGTRAKVRAGLATIVCSVAEDPRRGRLLFSPALSSTVLAHRRVESTRMFARLLGGQVREHYGIGESTALDLMTEFLVGGLAQALTSWLNGVLDLTEEGLVEHCLELFLAVEGSRLEPGEGAGRHAGTG